MPVSYKIHGLKETLANFKKWQVIKKEAIKTALLEAGFKIEAESKSVCPVDSGRLRASISTNWSGSSMDRGKVRGHVNKFNKAGQPAEPLKPEDGIGRPDGPPGLCVVVGTNVVYAPYVEEGTQNMPARHFMFREYFPQEGPMIRRIAVIMGKDEKLEKT